MRRIGFQFCFAVCVFIGAFGVVGASDVWTHSSWREGQALPSPRQGAVAVVSGDSIYLVGGSSTENYPFNATHEVESTVLRYKDGQWSAYTAWKMHYPRYLPAVVAVKEWIYVFGGMTGGDDSTFISAVERFNTDTEASELLNAEHDMPSARCCFSAAVYNSRIYLYGGKSHEEHSVPVWNDWMVFDTRNSQWLTEEEIEKEEKLKNGHNRAMYGVATAGDAVYFFGGVSEAGGLADVAKYDFVDNDWHYYGTGDELIGVGAAVVMANDSKAVYVIGGIGTHQAAPLNSVLEFSLLDQHTMHKVSHLNYNRSYHTAVLFENTIHVIGGWGPTADGPVRSDMEVLGVNPKTDQPEEANDAFEPNEGRDRGWWVVFAIIGALFVYFAAGIAIKYRQGARGGDVVPHREFWMELPSLVQEGGVIAFDFGRGVVQRFKKSEYRPLSQEQDDEEAVDTSRLSARSSARGAYGGVTA